jgi:hypothetical protein
MKVTQKLTEEILNHLVARGFSSWEEAESVYNIVKTAAEVTAEKCEEELASFTPAMAVFANHEHARVFLGLFTGKQHDIEAYLADRKAYGLEFEPANIRNIPSGFKAHRDNIIAKRDRLQAELNELNKRIENPDLI